MEVKKLAPPKVSHVEKVQARRHAGIFESPAVELDGHVYRVEVLSPKYQTTQPVLVNVRLSDGVADQLWLALPEWINPKLPGGDLQKKQLSELPKSLLLGVVKTQLSGLFALFPTLPKNVTQVVNSARVLEGLWTLNLRITANQEKPVVLSIHYPETAYPRIEQMLEHIRVQQPKIWDEVPVTASVNLGTCTVKMSDLKVFKKGDFLLLDRPNDYYRKLVTLAVNQQAVAKATLLDGALQVEKIMNEENHLNVGNVVSGLDDIPMTLDFRLAKKELSLSDLKRLGVGSIVSLNMPPKQLVSIHCNGKKIGNGELITVDSSVGVRIDSLVIDNNG